MVQNVFVFTFLMILAYSISGVASFYKKLGSLIFPLMMGVVYIVCKNWYLYMNNADNTGLLVSLSALAIIHGTNSLSHDEKKVIMPSLETFMITTGVVFATYCSFYVEDKFKFTVIAIEALSMAWAVMFMTSGGKKKMFWNELSNQDRYSMLVLSPLVILQIISHTIKPQGQQDELFEE